MMQDQPTHRDARNPVSYEVVLERVKIAVGEIAQLPDELQERHESSFWGNSRTPIALAVR